MGLKKEKDWKDPLHVLLIWHAMSTWINSEIGTNCPQSSACLQWCYAHALTPRGLPLKACMYTWPCLCILLQNSSMYQGNAENAAVIEPHKRESEMRAVLSVLHCIEPRHSESLKRNLAVSIARICQGSEQGRVHLHCAIADRAFWRGGFEAKWRKLSHENTEKPCKIVAAFQSELGNPQKIQHVILVWPSQSLFSQFGHYFCLHMDMQATCLLAAKTLFWLMLEIGGWYYLSFLFLVLAPPKNLEEFCGECGKAFCGIVMIWPTPGINNSRCLSWTHCLCFKDFMLNSFFQMPLKCWSLRGWYFTEYKHGILVGWMKNFPINGIEFRSWIRSLVFVHEP